MFKTLKKKPEKVKEKLDFKFRFHATRVPLAGWDKLVVSLIAVETGKLVIKTPRTNVRNGNCQWLESVIESTRLVHDVKNQEYEEKPYKLVVSMGSSRSGILGEATINLAEYAMSNDPAQIVLPLQNCSAGSVLHVNIQCITPKASTRPLAFVQSSSRDLSERSDLSVDQEDQEFAEDLDDSDLSESNTELTTSLSGSMSAIMKDGSSSSQLHGSWDSLDVPSTPSSLHGSGRSIGNADTPSPTSSGSSLPKRHIRSSSRDWNGKTRAHQVVKSPTSSGGRAIPASSDLTGQGLKNIWQDLHGKPIDRPTQGTTSDTGVHSNQVHHNGSQSSLQADLEAAEITIEELRSESIVWQRQAHKLGLEVDTLKQKLGLEVKQGAEVAAEKSALTAERDRLKLEVDQLQSEKKAAQERENGEDYASRQAEDTRRMMKEMQEEIAYQKEVNINLRLQLQKTQDSSMELVLAIKDMEETLDEQSKELNNLKALNSDLESSLSEQKKQSPVLAHVEKNWTEKLIEKDQEVQELQAKLLALENTLTIPVRALRPEADSDDGVVQTLQQKVQELQHNIEELENDSKELSNENIVLYTSLTKVSEDLKAKNELVIDLQAELKAMSEDSVQVPDVVVRTFASELPEGSTKLTCVTQELEDDEFRATEVANRRLCGDNIKLPENVPSLTTELQTGSSQFENKLTEPENIQVELESKLRESLETNRLMESQLQDVTISLREALLKIPELETSKAESDIMLQAAQEAGRLNRSRIEELEIYSSALAQEVKSTKSLHKDNESRILELESEKGEILQRLNSLLATNNVIGEQGELLVHEVASLRNQSDLFVVLKKDLETRLLELESIRGPLDSQLAVFVGENFHHVERILGLEAQLRHATEERETCKPGKGDGDIQLIDLQSKNSKVETSFQDFINEHQQKFGEVQTSAVESTEELLAHKVAQQNLETLAEEAQCRFHAEDACSKDLQSRACDLSRHASELDDSSAREAEARSRLESTIKQLEMLRQYDHMSRGKLKDLDKTIELITSENKRLAVEGETTLAITMEVETAEELMRLRSSLDKASGDKLALQNALETAHDENQTLTKSLAHALADVEDMMRSRGALEDKILRLQLDLDAQEAARSFAAEQRAESLKLERQNNNFRKQLTACEDEKEEFGRKLQVLEGELQSNVSALAAAEKKLKEGDDVSRSATGGTILSRSLSRSSSKVGPMSPSRETMELADLRDKVKFLELELKLKISSLESAKRDFNEKDTVLRNRIELLELANEQLARGGSDSGLDQLQMELHRLQTQNSSLARREQGLLSELGAQDVLKREVKRLQQHLEQLEKKLMKFKEATKDGDVLEKVFTLEMELGEALEANNMYKSQLRSAFAEQQNVHAAALQNLGDVDQVISDLLMFKRQSTSLEEELKEMRQRYSRMSLQFAEGEAQREELIMTMRTLKKSRKS